MPRVPSCLTAAATVLLGPNPLSAAAEQWVYKRAREADGCCCCQSAPRLQPQSSSGPNPLSAAAEQWVYKRARGEGLLLLLSGRWSVVSACWLALLLSLP